MSTLHTNGRLGVLLKYLGIQIYSTLFNNYVCLYLCVTMQKHLNEPYHTD